MKLHLRVSDMGFVSLSSAERIEAIDDRIAYFKERIAIRKDKLKVAQNKGKPALAELKKAQKSGRVPAAVKAAAKKAQAAIDLQQGKIDLLTGKIEKFTEKKKALKSKTKGGSKKAEKVVKTKKPAKAPKVEKTVRKTKVEKVKVDKPAKTKPTGRRRPGLETENDWPENQTVRPAPTKLRRKVERAVDPEPPTEPFKPLRAPKPSTKVKKLTIQIEPEPKLPQKNEPDLSSIHPQDVQLTKLVGDPSMFAKAKGKRSAMLAYIERVYDNANKRLFGGKLHRPHLHLLKAVSVEKFRLRGQYSYGKRLMQISPNLFGSGKEPLVVTTIVHEMCHQAVYELDRIGGAALKAEGGHGPNWRRWMVNVGLTPARFSKYDNAAFMDEATKQRVEQKKETIRSTKSKLEPLSPYQLHSLMAVSWVDSRKPDRTIPGILLIQNGKGPRTRWAVLTYDPRKLGLMTVMNVPVSIIYKPSEQDAKTVSTETWRNEAQRQISIAQDRKDNKRMRQSKGGRYALYDMLNAFMPK